MDSPILMANMDVSLHAAEDLRRSLDSRRQSCSRRLDGLSISPSSSSTSVFGDGSPTATDSPQLTNSQGSNGHWPRDYSASSQPENGYNIKSFETSLRFATSPSQKNENGRSCSLHSHTVGAEICPFDGSKYVLKPITSSSLGQRRMQDYQTKTEQKFSILFDNTHCNNMTYGCSDVDMEDNENIKLNADLWKPVSSTNHCDSSVGKITSSCRNSDDYTAKSPYHFNPYRRSNEKNGYSSSTKTAESCDGKNAAYNSTNPIAEFRKELEAKYESYREEYLTNSPVEELSTLNVAIVNVRKWLRRRNDTIKALLKSDSNKFQQDTAVVRRLISEAKTQQEGVDVLLDRGQRFLAQRANILLEVDLENLVFLWNSYTEDLRKFHSLFLKEGNNCSGEEISKFQKSGTTAPCSSREKSETRNLSFSDEKSLQTFKNNGYDAFVNHCLNGEEHNSSELKDTSLDSPSDVRSVDSGDLQLSDLSTSDSPLDILDLSTVLFCKSVPSSVGNISSKGVQNVCEQKKSNDNVQADCKKPTIIVPEEGKKMDPEMAERVPIESDQKLEAASVSVLGAGMGRGSSQNSLSPGGSSEALAYFDRASHPVMESISLGSPTEPKRRRKLLDTPSSVSSISSRSGSPISLKDSGCTTPTGTLTHPDRQKDLWKAIGNIDSFLMDQDILEACKSTENDLSSADEECVGSPSVSFAEFLQQYKELIDWLNQMHKVVQREVTSLSEKYLNQSYHEEMLERSPRREFLNQYSVQVLLRYPNMSEQISARMNRLNAQWAAVEQAIAPKHGKHDEESMLQDLECDLSNLRRWLNAIESRLLPLTIQSDWSDSELEERLVQHQVLQRDIESHNKVINAVLKLSERLEQDWACGSPRDRDSLQLVALNLERRWHGIWLQSLEWQCRLEEGIGRRKGIYNSGLDFSQFSLPVLDESLFNHCSQDINDQGLITLDDDSLLFIGGGRGFTAEFTSSPDSEAEFDGEFSFDALYSSKSDLKDSHSLSIEVEEDGGRLNPAKINKEEGKHAKSQVGKSNSKPDSPLGKRRFPEGHYEGSPAKKVPSSYLASSGELSPISPESPLGSAGVSSEDCLSWQSVSDIQCSPGIPIDDLKTLKVKRSLFDRSSGDSANISETESKMSDSPPGPAIASSEGENEPLAVLPVVAKAEPKDIGYSSESQSNDEVESMRQQIAMEYKFPGKCELASDGPLGDKVLFPSVSVRSCYYQMTHVTDVDSTDKTDNGDTTDSGPERTKEKVPVEKGINSGTDEFETAVKDVYSQLESSSNAESDFPHGRNKNNKNVSMSNSCSQTDNPVNNLVPIHQLVDFSESDSAPESKGKKSVRYLIEHAEELVRPSTSPKRGSPLSPQKVSSSTQSLLIPSPSKQTQTDSCATVESSCDASGEDNSDHEGSKLRRGELSTGTDDAEDRTLCDSVINLGSATESANNVSQEETKHSSFQTSCASSFQTGPVIDSPHLRKQTGRNSRRRSNRPWSVVGFQDFTASKKSENSLPVVAVSESAINNLQCHTDSDSCSTTSPMFLPSSYSSTFPRSTRNGKPHTVSLCEHTSYYNIVTATQDLTTTTPSIQQSIASLPSPASLISSEVSSGADVPNQNRSKRRRAKRSSSLRQSSQEPPAVSLPVYHNATDSYESADAASESEETTDDYLTACMEICTSEAEDIHNVSGSLSEHSTWDNYQMFYPTGSEDPGEELLTWEPQDDLEFEDDFQLPPERCSSILNDVMGSSKAKGKLKIKKHGGMGEDSDSDLEDFHDILNQSELQLKLANQSLKKKRHDPMGTSLHPNPDKYAEILVTYDTNIKCLETICQHLNTEDVTEADVKRVQDLMEEWGKVYNAASERHAQTAALGELRDIMATMNKSIQEVGDSLSFDKFSTADELRETIVQLKERQAHLSQQASTLDSLKSRLAEFSSQHPAVCVDRYWQDMHRLVQDNNAMLNKLTDHANSLENNWSVWVEYLDSQRELDGWLAADRERLHSLLSQREFGARVTKKDVLRELETLQQNLCAYEAKLSVLQAMYSRLTRTSNQDAQRLLLASLGDLRNQLLVVSQRCRHCYQHLEEDEELDLGPEDLGKLSMQAAAVHEMMTAQDEPSLKIEASDWASSDVPSTSKVDPKDLAASRHCVSWLRSVPVQVVALVLVAGLLYALDPEILDWLTNFSLSITPELRYVNGPPTI